MAYISVLGVGAPKDFSDFLFAGKAECFQMSPRVSHSVCLAAPGPKARN